MDSSAFERSWDRIPQRTFTVRVSGSSSNAVSIPVRFVNLDAPQYDKAAPTNNMDQTSAAKRIQSAFRGFSVRKTKPLENLKIIAKVKASMEEMQRRINDPQFLELIRQNEKERFKIAEGIMALLLKLDEIQGVKSFVQEARRAVAHDLVSLHERVDDISNRESTEKKGMEVSMDQQKDKEGAARRCWLAIRLKKIMRRSYWTH